MPETHALTAEHAAEIRNIIRETVSQTVRETLFQIGIIIDDHGDVVEFRKDMAHLRKWRGAVESVENRSVMITVSVLITGFFAALWLGLQALFTHT